MRIRILLGLWGILFSLIFFSCGKERGRSTSVFQMDSLNSRSYAMRYKNLDESERLALQALGLGKEFSISVAEALNNLGFCAFIRMDFERADSLLGEVYNETANELECLVADVGMMKICQRTSMNKEFYDYRNRAMRRMKRIEDSGEALADEHIRYRFNYARTEFYITSAVYYFYLQQEQQSLEAMAEIRVEEELKGDTAQWLYYEYMKGSGGLYVADTPEEVVVGEFDYLLDCLITSHEQGYIYFEANASQAMAELLKTEKNYQLLLERRPGMMRVINREDVPWENLVLGLSERAIELFKQYGDWYQISGSYRTKASCLNEQDRYEEALDCLTEALSYVNLHHEKYYHCHDTIDRLKTYVPLAIHSIELEWINKEGIQTVPEWIARFREQLSVTYAALGMKPESDYNRNIYLDILDYTRQDKELESRYQTLEKESAQLTIMLVVVVIGIIVLISLLWIWNRHWRIHNKQTIRKLETVLEVCRKMTAAVPGDAVSVEDVTMAILEEMKGIRECMDGLMNMSILLDGEKEEKSADCICTEFPLYTSDRCLLGLWKVYSYHTLKKDDKALLKVMLPYISWTIENGLTLISLGDERRMLEKEQYVHQQHLVENKRQNIVKKACLAIVTGITPYIDRVINEVHKLIAFNYFSDKDIKEGKYQYISDLITRINEYNDILALWIKMRQGSLNLNIESFGLNSLFEVLQKSRRTFEAKGLTFTVKPTDTVVKADKALTLFMINTLADNARKYTPQGGEVSIYADEGDDYVEISVQDNGVGLTAEEIQSILGEKVYDSGKIGMRTGRTSDDLKRKKGDGFGLMNCKGIIEKYRKTNELFRVCRFHIDSELGHGSRFSFRLPKGIRRTLGIGIVMGFMTITGCTSDVSGVQEMLPDTLVTNTLMNDTLLVQANDWANRIYQANVEGNYQEALAYADTALSCLNDHYLKYAGTDFPLLELRGESDAAELEWFFRPFDTDYYALLDIRNEAAIACLALGDLEGYRYNNQLYTALYKQISVDTSLEQYCKRMESSANQKFVAIVLCIVLLLVFLFGYYMLYFRHLLSYRYNLEQVMEINRQAFTVPIYNVKERETVASLLVSYLFKGLNELIPMDNLGIGLYDEEHHSLSCSFSSEDEKAVIQDMMEVCWKTRKVQEDAGKRMRAVPLCVELCGTVNCVGVLAFRSVYDTERTEEYLMMDLVAGYIAVVIYHAIELVAQKYRDIELVQDENRRVQREENLLYVQNQVLDNCLSTIKHETIYYPNRIKQIVDRLRNGRIEVEERRQVEIMEELITYYKDIFTILSSCASRQLEEVTFRRGRVTAKELADSVSRYINRTRKRTLHPCEWKMKVEEVTMTGDVVQLNFLLENLVNEALTCKEPGLLELHIYQEGAFVRFDFIDRRRTFTQDELNLLFYPHLAKMKKEGGEMLEGTEYLICKQIIREHDEFAGRRGCRINAQQLEGGGFMVWFTIPSI